VTHRGLVSRYLELALTLARYEPELVDSYYGPSEIAVSVARDEPRGLDVLAHDADALLSDAAGDSWLVAQVLALRTTARRLAGESLPYEDEVEATYGVRPRWFDEEGFRDAHAQLDDALPGRGSIRDRFCRWTEETVVPAQLVEPAARSIAAEARQRTRRLIGLPAGARLELEFVTGGAPRGYAHHLGALRSRVSINVERPLGAADLAHLVAHEAYPGHHAHRAWQEAEAAARGQIERTIDVVWSPDALIAEGIAEAGAALVVPDGQELAASVLGPLGFAYDAEVGARVAAALRLLAPVNSNAMLLLRARGATAEEVRAYVVDWSLQTTDRAARTVERLAVRRSPGYVHTYSHGFELVRRHVSGDAGRLRALMTARLAPAEL
jgi:hypothetical protein